MQLPGHRLRCLACARRCVIEQGRRGFCRVRTNEDGALVAANYGRVVTGHIDVIEKKPAYHYRPGSKLLSIGTVGCNWSCDFCVNAEVSQADEVIGKRLSPTDVIQLAKQYGCQGIAYTYNEPLVLIEFARDIGILAHREGLFNVVVSNGYGTPEAVGVLSEFADCIIVGLKANASPSFLKKHLGIRSPNSIFETLLGLKRRAGIHIEINDLILGRNFELAIAIALTAFASMPMVAVSTVVGPLIEIPVMLAIVWMALRRRNHLQVIEVEAKSAQKVGKGGIC